MRRLALLAVVLMPLTIALWASVWEPWRLEWRRESVVARLPALPSLDRYNQVSIEKFRQADRRAREDPLASDMIGRLGMLYHAYHFADLARQCYRLAGELAPGTYRWVYYQAVLEKSVFAFTESEALFLEAIELQPRNADAWAELGDLYLQWGRRDDAAAALARALDLDPQQPLAALGRARLAILAEDWPAVIERLTPVLAIYPRLSLAHSYLAVAYGNMGRETERDHHQALAEYGSAVETPLMRELHALSVDAILEGGDPAKGAKLLKVKCASCHTHGRINAMQQPRRWWAGTVRRMQRLAGWEWLTDEEAADLIAFLSMTNDE